VRLRSHRFLVPLALVLVLASASLVGADPGEKAHRRFEFALIGDAPYTPPEEAQFENLIDEINREKMAFTLHIGDIQGGRTPCTDEILERNLRYFDSFERPVVYTPGDNEWTGCHRTGGDPLARLARVRAVLASRSRSFGERRIKLTRQSAAFPENVRFSHGGVTFVSLHIVGSNNNLPRAPGRPGNAEEYAARNRANLEWLEEGFEIAAEDESRALVLFIQADPRFELAPEERTGFNDFLAALERETLAFAKPVALLHGDTHVFRIDRPLKAAGSGRRLLNFTRVESFGSPEVHWVRASVDPNRKEVFSFRDEIVEKNLVP
jgi:hypothetical protein